MSDKQVVTMVPFEVQRAEAFAKAQAEAAEKKMDQTVPGGRYVQPDGTVVDANGKPITGGGSDGGGDGEYGRMTVAELRAEADARGIDVPADARKADLVAALEGQD